MANPPPSLSGLSSVKLALMAKQARAQLGPIVRAEPIAVVGIGCRFPGGVDSPDTYWSLLRDGVDAVGPIPADRWDVDALYDPDPAAPGKLSARFGGFLRQVDRFDAPFFGILRREAERMDPQQRLFLEVAIEALDHAGLSRERLAGSATGVFIASYYNDYTLMQLADREWIDGRTLTGTQHSVLANRLSYLLDLRGPSISIDTACSSSLVAVHLACQSLRAGESETALAGGVSLMLAPELMITLSKVGFMSASGRCRTFDAGADGFIRGEGCGVVVLKRLSDAIADSDRVLAVIRGSAVNQDGHSTVLAAPNGLAQQALVREALENAQLSPSRVGFVEAHGTATPLGDPIEVEALASVIGAPRADGSPCYLGSAKANLGHLEAAAGVAGLIKATLVLKHAELPRQLHFERPNPHLSLTGTCLKVSDRHQAWPAGAQARVAGVSGFGVGGTNAHVLLEEAPSLPAPEPPEDDEPRLLVLSAQSPAALRALASRWVEMLSSTPASLAKLAATASQRRSHYDQRLALVARNKQQAESSLRAFVAQEPVAELCAGQRPTSGAPRVAFVFSGQGPQWARMSAELAAAEPVFRDTLADLDARFRALSGWSLSAALSEPAESSRLQETELAQPAIFAVQVALAALWRSLGVEPAAVVGHSIGELAALYVAGVLSLDDAVRIVWHRGRIMQRATGNGRMAAASISEAEALALVQEVGPELSVAAVNAPRNVTLSGTARALETALAALDARGVSHRALPVSYAFHSAQMDPFRAELLAAIGELKASPGRIAVYSSVTGRELEDGAIDAAYFGQNLRQTVRFAAAVDTMLGARLDAFVELAPHPVLVSSISECLAERGLDIPVVGSMRRERAARETWLRACAALYGVGVTLEWRALFGAPTAPVDLPAYPWQRERYWLRSRPALEPRGAPHAALLGARSSDADGAVWYRVELPSEALKWVDDHRVAGRVVMPAVALLEALRAAAQDVFGDQPVRLLDFVVQQPLALEAVSGFTSLVTLDADGARLELWAGDAAGRPDPDRDRLIASARATTSPLQDTLGSIGVASETWETDREGWYARFAELGVAFGPSFHTLERWRSADSVAEGWLELAAGSGPGAGDSGVSAALLDGALQLCLLAASSGAPSSLLLPLAIESFTRPRRLPARVRAQVRITERGGGGSLGASVRLFSDDGALVAALDGVRLAPASAAALNDVGAFEVHWRPAPNDAASEAPARGDWLVLTHRGQPAQELIDALTAAGGRCHAIAVTEPAELERQLTAASARFGAPLRGVVHAASLDADEHDASERYDVLTSGSALTLVQALGRGLFPGAPLWLLTRGAQPVLGSVTHPRQAGIWGLASVATAEYPERPCRVLDLDPSSDPASLAASVATFSQSPAPPRSAIRAGARYVPRLERRHDTPASSGVKLACEKPGTLDGLRWQPTAPRPVRSDEVRLQVLAAGLNFRDVLLALGMYPGLGAVLGAECAGTVVAVGDAVSELKLGDVVFGFAPGSLASEVVVPARFLRKLPSGLKPELAAALPAAYLTAMYGLERVAQLEPGSSILVHAGAGGVGMAAIQVARRRGYRVFATAGSPAKRDLLQSLGVEQSFDSRSLAFADQLLAATNGRGVDAVLNSLSGDFIPASVRTVARNGWFLELGKRGVWSAEQMRDARPDLNYHVYDLGTELEADPTLAPSLLGELCERLSDGSLRPLPVRSFDFPRAADAFRLMAQAGHVGKLVLRASSAAPRSLARSDATYWITGGAGALGLETARWLVASGARQLLLTGRSQPSAEARAIFDECRAAGARLEFRIADAGDAEAMAAVRDELRASWPALKGVVHAAGVVDDGVLRDQTWPRWRAVLRGKVDGARLLDALTAESELDFFVVYSSAGWLLGPLGQGAYAAANAELDALAWWRRANGRPATSVGWGQWRAGGMAARLAARGHDAWSARGLGWLAPSDAFRALEQLLLSDAPHALVLPIQWDRFLETLPPGVDASFFEAVRPARRAARATKLEPAKAASLVEVWKAKPASARLELLLEHLTERARLVLGVGEDVRIDRQAPLKAAGLDSLMAVELRNLLARSLGASLPATLLFDYPSLEALASYLSNLLQLTPATASAATATAAAPPPKPTQGALDALAQMSDAEAEAELLAELGGAEGAR